jgi:hypothetical protein
MPIQALAIGPYADAKLPLWDVAKQYLITHYPQPSRSSTNHEHSFVSAGLNDGTEQSPISKGPQ